MSKNQCEERKVGISLRKQRNKRWRSSSQNTQETEVFLSSVFQRQFPNLVLYCLPKSLAFVSHFLLQCLQSVLVQESLHMLLSADGMVGFGILPRAYHLLGSFSACHLSPLCFFMFLTVEILTAKYFVEVVGRFSGVINCSLFRLLVQLPYGNCCQLKVCASVHETTSAHNFPYSSDPGDASGNLFSTIKGYL